MTQIDNVTKIIVKRRYFPSSGTAKDVGGMISASSKKKTVNDSKIEMQRVTWKTKSISILSQSGNDFKAIILATFSPESEGR